MNKDWFLDRDPADLCDSFDDYESDFYEVDMDDEIDDLDTDYEDYRPYHFNINSQIHRPHSSHPYTPTLNSVLVGVKYSGCDTIFYYTSKDTSVKEGDTVRVNTPSGIEDLVVLKRTAPNTSMAPDPIYQKGEILEIVSRGKTNSKPKAVIKPEHIEQKAMQTAPQESNGISKDKYVYVGIRYYDYAKTYNFISDDWSVNVGDTVRVPSTKYGFEDVKVISRGVYDATNAPYPPSYAKHIISIVSRGDSSFSPEVNTNFQGLFSESKKGSTENNKPKTFAYECEYREVDSADRTYIAPEEQTESSAKLIIYGIILVIAFIVMIAYLVNVPTNSSSNTTNTAYKGYQPSKKQTTTTNNSTTSSKDTSTGGTKYVSQTTNIRMSPDLSGEKVGELPGGSSFEYLGQASNGWYIIEYDGAICFISNLYVVDKLGGTSNSTDSDLVFNVTDIDAVFLVTSRTNIRNNPSLNSDIVGSVEAGTYATVNGKCDNGNWYRLEYAGQTAYMSGLYLEPYDVTPQE